MKFAGLASLALFGLATASPTPTIEKRAAISDACDLGFASTNGGTKGGAGGTTTTVSSLAQLTAAAEADGAAVVVVKGSIKGSAKVRVGSDKTIVGAKGSSLEGVGFYIKKQSNVIMRNLKISKVEASNGDAIGIDTSSNVWVDHCDLSSDLAADKDFYDGLLDVSHGCDWVTVSNTYLHDHHKASLVGHSDSNSAEDKGHLTVSYINNHWANVGSRTPLVRFGTVHVVNNYYDTVSVTGINTRMGAQVLVESSQFANSDGVDVITSVDSKETGTATVNDVDLGGGNNVAPKGSMSASSLGYTVSKVGSAKVKSAVVGTAGQTLSF